MYIVIAVENINRIRDILGCAKTNNPPVFRFDVRKDHPLFSVPLHEHEHGRVSPQEAEDHQMEINATWEALNKLFESRQGKEELRLEPLCPLPGGYYNVPVSFSTDNWDIDRINNLLAKQKANFRIRAKVEKKLAEAAPADQPSLRNMVEAQPPLVIFGATGHEINLKWIQWYIMTTQCSKESAFFTAESILKRLANN